MFAIACIVAGAALTSLCLLMCSGGSRPRSRAGTLTERSRTAIPFHVGNTDTENVKGTLRLVGQVLDESDHPVPAARVWVMPGNQSVISGEDGAFALEGLAARAYQLRGKRDDLYSGPVDVVVSDASEPQTLRVRAGATLIVHVTGERAPVIGARVTLGTEPDPDGTWTQVTDATGTAVHRGLLPQPYTFRIAAQGWASGTEHAFPRAEDPTAVIEVSVALKRGAPIEGIVLGPDGQRVPAASVVFGDMGNFGAWVDATGTDASGVWRLDVIPAGSYSVTATADAFARSESVVVQVDGQTARKDVVLRLQPGGQLNGVVVDEHGNPIAAADVEAEIVGENGARGRTRDDGRFELAGLRPAKYLVRARKGRLASPSQNIVLDHGVRQQVTLVLQDTAIAGIVVDDRGKPAANVGVVAFSHSFYWPYRQEPVITDEGGRFELTGMEPGEFRVVASRTEETPRESDPEKGPPGVIARTGERNVKIVMPTWGTITGRVMFNGAPMPHYGVVLGAPDFWRLGASPRGFRSADGRFTLKNVEPGPWELQILGPGTALRRVENLTLRAGQVLDVGDIVMSRGQRISGHVFDSAGRPIAGALVEVDGGAVYGQNTELQRWFEGKYNTVTDSNGAYLLDGIAPVQVRHMARRIAASHVKFGASQVHELPAGDATVDFTLSAVGAVDGVIDGYRGFVFIEARRTHDPEPLRSHTTSASQVGTFSLENLPVGEYELLPEGDPGATISSARVIVQANQRTAVKLTMSNPNVKVTVQVPWGKHEAVAFVKVGTDGRDERLSPNLIMDRRLVFDAVVPGTYKVSLDGRHWKPIVVTEQPSEQTIDLDPS